MSFRSIIVGFLCIPFIAIALSATVANAQVTSGPQQMIYNGHLLDSSGSAITTKHTIRFSFWSATDYVSTDVTSTGALHIASSNYANWNEEQDFTPNSDGYFTVQMGSGTALPDFSTMDPAILSSLHLQVEIKADGAADTSYEFLDIDSNSTTIDRSPLLSVPFSLNADRVDQRSIGTGSGSIPLLLKGGVLSPSHIPGGTQSGTFTIDIDNSESGDIELQFGGDLAKKLSYDQVNTYFKFNDDVHIEGNLTLTGLVDGVDISSLDTTSSNLKVSSGGGLNVNIAAGSYRISGTTTNYAGVSGLSVVDNDTNYVFATSTGVFINTVGFPTNHSVIPFAEVVTLNGGVNSIVERRILSSDDRERDMQKVFHPEFAGASFQADATNNVGQLSISFDDTNDKNFYLWTTTTSTLQDYDVVLPVTLPEDFAYWNTNPLTVTYRSTSADILDNEMDVSVFDTNGSAVSLTGSASNLYNTSWQSGVINYSGAPTWTAGQDFVIKFKMFARNSKQMHLGKVILDYTELP